MMSVSDIQSNQIRSLGEKLAGRYAGLAIEGITRQYPNHPQHVLNNPADLKEPRALHPAFYGCFDWHSAVHSHWALVRLLRIFPTLPQSQAIRSALHENLSAKNLLIEAAYFSQPNRQSFERMYGWAWLLKLAQELLTWEDRDGALWSRNLQPLVDTIVARYLEFTPKQTYPLRVGTHPNTAFGLAFALDYARAASHQELKALLVERARFYFAQDVNYPAQWEPSGSDFFSPSLIEADLMRRVLPLEAFRHWFKRFLPGISSDEPQSLLNPVTVSDHSDPQLVHLDGLHLSRAWCMRRIGAALPENDPARAVLSAAEARHLQAGLAHVASGDYMGEHWLASFAIYALTD